MPADKNASLSEKERALIEEARRMITRRPAAKQKAAAAPATPYKPAPISKATPAPAPVKEQTSIAQSAQCVAKKITNSAADSAAHIAALMQAEREETARRRQQVRWWGIYLPLSISTLAVLWIAITMVR